MAEHDSAAAVGARLAGVRQRFMAEQMTTQQGLEDALEIVRVAEHADPQYISVWLDTLTMDELGGLARLAKVLEHVGASYAAFVGMGVMRHARSSQALNAAAHGRVPVS